MAIDWSNYRAEERLQRAFIQNPAELHTVERCQSYDMTAARYIEELKAEIEEMEAYRQELFARMQQIYSTPYTLKITLTRERRESGIFYWLQLWHCYDDPTIEPEAIESTRYAGKERARAIRDYHAALKAHPDVACSMDIAKRKWER